MKARRADPPAVRDTAEAPIAAPAAGRPRVPARLEPTGTGEGIDYRDLYEAHPEYVARRESGSLEQQQIELEVRLFKLPHLLALLPQAGIAQPPASILEIGCATGELIASMPVAPGGRRVGLDIAPGNIAAARTRFPAVEFGCCDFREVTQDRFDVVVISDVLEHVPDDVAFLRDAAHLGSFVLVNLPLEDNWLNRKRRYGPDDASGHLRRYDVDEGLALFDRAGLETLAHHRVWVHETPAEPACRALRRRCLGSAYAGAWPLRLAKRGVFAAARAVPPFGRRLFASNLFVVARPRPQA